MTAPLTEQFAGQMGQLLGPEFPEQIALAVSGGGDSMAMLALAHDWARIFGVRLQVVTVDHGLREASAAEAAMVARECAALGHPHTTLHWHWDGQGNLQDAARRARLSLIEGWRDMVDYVLFAHTRDDVAETFLMRLARGSGVEGLSAMAAMRRASPGGFWIVRPLLGASRAVLRHYIDTLKVPYVDDPSNDDPRFDRVRARAALQELRIGADRLAATAERLSRASDALRARVGDVAARVARTDEFGTVHMDRDGFASVERDTQLRLLAGALCWVSDAAYRPRVSALEGLLERILAGGGGTLHGAEICVEGAKFIVFRELNAIGPQDPDATLWDGRWRVSGEEVARQSVRPLGPLGWDQLPKEARSGLDHRIAKTLPALFDGEMLAAFAPAHFGHEYGLLLEPDMGTFMSYLVSR